MVTAADEFGAVSQRGQLVTGVFEHPNGLVVVSVLSSEAILLVLVQPDANVGQLLFELRRNREHMAALV
jgi:predicted regulator of Ras-like GTPase activity (Roadblock/LC7/MglB family)